MQDNDDVDEGASSSFEAYSIRSCDSRQARMEQRRQRWRRPPSPHDGSDGEDLDELLRSAETSASDLDRSSISAGSRTLVYRRLSSDRHAYE